uniref:Uncharacterized protein n=1 Tax=Lepeophtheirus salmonis TaxID=72036 RepID=A0A0K2VBP4_LEPSM
MKALSLFLTIFCCVCFIFIRDAYMYLLRRRRLNQGKMSDFLSASVVVNPLPSH